MKVKKTGLLFGAVAIFGIGFFVGRVYHAEERYQSAWEAGKKYGFSDGEDVVEKEWANYGKEHSAPHHYEFKQHGASIYRFDSDTGESCWVQLSEAEGDSPMSRCPR